MPRSFGHAMAAALHMTNAGGAKVSKSARKTDAGDTDTAHDQQHRLKKLKHGMLTAK